MSKKFTGKSRKMIAVLVSLVLVATLAVSGTLAWLVSSTPEVTNTFTAANVGTQVEETISTDGKTKESVQIKNTGDVPAYIRAMVVVTWQKGDEVYGTAPQEDVHYDITWFGTETNGGWIKGDDGFYYHKAPVAAGNSTSVLFTECKEINDSQNKPAGYELHVEILCSGIQALPTNAVTEAWGVTLDENNQINSCVTTESN